MGDLHNYRSCIPCTMTSFFGRFGRVSTCSSDGNDLLRCPEARGSVRSV